MTDRGDRGQSMEGTHQTAASALASSLNDASVVDLMAAEAQERQGPNRKGVLEAIDRRRTALQSPDEPTYTADDLVAGESDAGRRAMIRGAFAFAGVERLSADEARALVDAFSQREVPAPGEGR